MERSSTIRKMLCVLLALVLAVATLPARDLSSDDSPTSDTTGGRFGSDFDRYLSVADWSALESNVLFLQFGGPNDMDPGQFQAGTGLYLGGLYLGAYLGSAFPRTDADNSTADGGTSQFFVENGRVTAVENSTETRVEENKLQDTDLGLIVGLTVGDIAVGIKNTVDWTQDNETGTVRPIGPTDNVPASVFPQFVASFGAGDLFGSDLESDDTPLGFQTAQTGTSTIIRDADGNATYQNAATIGEDGYVNDSEFTNTLSVGAALPLAMFDVTARLDLGFGTGDFSAQASETQFETFYNDDYADFAGVSNAQSYFTETATKSDSWLLLDPELALAAGMAMSDTLRIGFGVTYGLKTYIGDPISWDYSSTNYTTTIDGNGFGIDTVETRRSLNVTDDWSRTIHTIHVPVNVQVTPSDVFRYSVEYRPEIVFSKSSQSLSGSYSQTETEVFADPGSPTVVTTQSATIESIERETLGRTVNHNLDLGAQFFLAEKIRVNLGTDVSMQTLNLTKTSVDAGTNSTFTETEAVGDLDAVTTTDDFNQSISDGAQDRDTVRNSVTAVPNVDYSIGFSYFFSDDMDLDLEYRAATGNIWDLGSWSALMTIRY
jgi:hypothetical protein